MDFFSTFSTKVAYADLDTVITHVDELIINPLISFLFALAVLFFLYGVFQFLVNQDNEEAKSTGKQHMMWGVIGITIMMGVWGILNLLINTLGVSDQVKLKDNGNNSRGIEVTLPK